MNDVRIAVAAHMCALQVEEWCPSVTEEQATSACEEAIRTNGIGSDPQAILKVSEKIAFNLCGGGPIQAMGSPVSDLFDDAKTQPYTKHGCSASVSSAEAAGTAIVTGGAVLVAARRSLWSRLALRVSPVAEVFILLLGVLVQNGFRPTPNVQPTYL